MKVLVHSGSITTVKADALITTIDLWGVWSSRFDTEIRVAPGDYFHDQAERVKPLSDGQTVIAHGESLGLPFTNVVFVVDGLVQPLQRIVKAGLSAARDAGFQSVTLRPMRMAQQVGDLEMTRSAVSDMFWGVAAYLEEQPPNCIKVATFVSDDPQVAELLSAGLAGLA
jgi:hypothetical protein